jgi:hypothetical protein
VTRALRILAICGLLVIGVDVLWIAIRLSHATNTAPLPVQGENLVLLTTVVLQSSFFLVFAAGIVATVASLQQQRPRWAAVFIILLVVVAFSPESINYLLSFLRIGFLLGLFGGLVELILVQVVLPALLASLVLAFTFTRRSEVAVP